MTTKKANLSDLSQDDLVGYYRTKWREYPMYLYNAIWHTYMFHRTQGNGMSVNKAATIAEELFKGYMVAKNRKEK